MVELLNTIVTLLDFSEKMIDLSKEDFKIGIVLFGCLNVTSKKEDKKKLT